MGVAPWNSVLVFLDDGEVGVLDLVAVEFWRGWQNADIPAWTPSAPNRRFCKGAARGVRTRPHEGRHALPHLTRPIRSCFALDQAAEGLAVARRHQMDLGSLILLIVIGTSVWVFFDAPSHGLSRTWALGALALWIVAFPWYLVERGKHSPRARLDSPPPGGHRWWDGRQWTEHWRPGD